MNEVLYCLRVLVNALADQGIDPGQYVDLRGVWDGPEQQADAFFRGYVEGWRHMHDEMRAVPAVRDLFKVTPVAVPVSPVSSPESQQETVPPQEELLSQVEIPTPPAEPEWSPPEPMPRGRPFLGAEEVALAAVPVAPGEVIDLPTIRNGVDS